MIYIINFIGDCCQDETVREDEDMLNRKKKLIVVLSFHSISFPPFFPSRPG